MKSAWPVEPPLSIPTSLMGAHRVTPMHIQLSKDFFADMLPVKVFMSLLHSIVIKSQV